MSAIKRIVAVLCIAIQLALVVFLISFIGSKRTTANSVATIHFAESEQELDEILLGKEKGAVVKVLENDIAKKLGYFEDLLADFNNQYKKYGITAVDANLNEQTDLERDGPSGYAPDVVYQANDKIMRYVTGKHILPLPIDMQSSSVAQAAYDPFKLVVKENEIEKTVYCGVPVDVSSPMLYYRKDMLPNGWDTTHKAKYDKNNNGVFDPIENWNAMYSYSKEINENDNKRWGYMKSLLDPYFSLGYLYSYGGYCFGDNNTNDKDVGLSKGDAEKGARVLYQQASTMNAGCYDFTITETAYSKIGNGNFFATITTPNVHNNFVKSLIDNGKTEQESLGTAPLPKLPKSGDLQEDWSNDENFMPSTVMGGVNGYAVSSYTKYPNASYQFIKFATSKERMLKRNAMLGVVPVRADAVLELGELQQDIYNNLVTGKINVMPSIRSVAQIWDPVQSFFMDLCADPFRSSSKQKYNTLEAMKKGLQDVDKSIYDAIWTLQ